MSEKPSQNRDWDLPDDGREPAGQQQARDDFAKKPESGGDAWEDLSRLDAEGQPAPGRRLPDSGGAGQGRGGGQFAGIAGSIILIIILNILSFYFDWGWIFY